MVQKWESLSFAHGYNCYFELDGKRLEVKECDVFDVDIGKAIFKKCTLNIKIFHCHGRGGMSESTSEMTASAKTQKGFSIVLEEGFKLRKNEKESKKLGVAVAKRELEKAKFNLKKEERAMKKRLAKTKRELKKLDS